MPFARYFCIFINVGLGEGKTKLTCWCPDMSSYASGSATGANQMAEMQQVRLFPGEHGPVSANVSFPIPFTQTPGIVIVCDLFAAGMTEEELILTGLLSSLQLFYEGGAFFDVMIKYLYVNNWCFISVTKMLHLSIKKVVMQSE